MRRYFSFAILFIALCSGNAFAADSGIKIFMVDENGDAFSVQTVRWWYVAQRNNRVELKCVDNRCDERLLKQAWTSAIIVAADTAVVEPDDDSCWKLYHGEVQLDLPVQEIKIVMHSKNKVCK